jgi:HK97 gp10 family phage protein
MIEIRGLDSLENRIRELERNTSKLKDFLIRVANEVKADATNNTPVDTGTLRRGWVVTNPYQRGGKWYIAVGNNTEYADNVEYGTYKQQGKHMLEYAMDDLKGRMDAELRRFVEEL